jgi:two-component system, cell cycle sensor histidine kinase and response regulator CckA
VAADESKTKAELMAELAELRRSQRMTESLLDATHDLVFLVDPEGFILDLNEAAAKSMDKSRDEVRGANLFSHFSPGVAQARRARLKECVDSGEVVHFDDGRAGAFSHNSVHPILDGEGSVEMAAVFTRKLTSRRVAASELKLEKAFLEAALDASSDTFFVFEIDSGKPVRWNRVFREVSGYCDAEIAAMKAPQDFYDSVDLEIAHGALRALSETGYARVELPLLSKHGKKIRYEYVVSNLETIDGATPLACSVGRDVTDRKQAEKALQESEEKYRIFLDSLSAGVVAHAPNTEILYCNKMALQILGLSEGQMLGKVAMDPQWKFLREDGSALAVEEYPVNLTLSTQSNLTGYVVGVERPATADVAWALCNTHRVLAGNGELEHILISFFDITDRKESEETRRNLESQVQHRQKLESLGVLAGGIAHDFNNLLMTILGNADLALEDLSPVSPVRPNIQEIEGAARRAADLAKQMLAYSGRGAFEVAQLDLNELVGEMAYLLESSISKKTILKTRLDADLPAINADAAQVQQVVMNLITNASEAIGDNDPGVVTVSADVLECTREYLATSYLDEKQPEGRYVAMDVADTGCGMDAATKSTLFDPFFTTKFTGRGLGLAAVLGIVRGHGGAIMVDSELGRGTTFRVLFPAGTEDRKMPSAAGDLRKREDWRGAGTVLVVDDEDTVRRVAVKMVARLGFNVLLAADGQECVDVFTEHSETITCVILDLTMPRMDGGEACLAIQEVRDDVPVILSSGYEESEISARFDGYGMAGFLKKPYQLTELRRVLQAVLAPGGEKNKE